VQAHASVAEQVNAGKHKLTPAEAVKLAYSVRHVYVAKGKKLVHFDMEKAPPADEELRQHMIGPSGNLRAPTARSGDRLFVGFNPEEYAGRLWGGRS
jgi:hypothetical protein